MMKFTRSPRPTRAMLRALSLYPGGAALPPCAEGWPGVRSVGEIVPALTRTNNWYKTDELWRTRRFRVELTRLW